MHKGGFVINRGSIMSALSMIRYVRALAVSLPLAAFSQAATTKPMIFWLDYL